MSTSPRPIFSAMWRELISVGMQGTIFSVAMTAAETIDFFPSSISSAIQWTFFVTAIFEMCSIFKPPPPRWDAHTLPYWNGSLQEYPLMQALVDVALCGVVTLTHYKLDENELHLTEKNEKMIEKDEYGVMVNMCLVFLNSLKILIACRCMFLVLDFFGGGHLSHFVRNLVSSEVEGYPIDQQPSNDAPPPHQD
ncbi:uncharacterized protein LOC118436457 isoform X2 [Folsomia candida]|uniref:uncharacterized protein LOC118436457 isoform X2 n=1 Tax=Folsomia candida TaxID=158441 RepID=UPI0016050B35|nr:uncharacterized protein LOC118436457 isoform X2 [Folsomia candida]